MKYTRLASLLALFLCLNFSLFAQSEGDTEPESELSEEHMDAKELFAARRYTLALEMYQEAYSEAESDEEKGEITFKIAECYRFLEDYRRAESQYERAQRFEYGPEAIYMQGIVLMSQGEYEDAIEKFQEYQQVRPGDNRVEERILMARQAVEWMDNPPTRYQVTNMGRDVNSRQSDHGPAWGGRRGRETESLLFLSQREEATGRDEDGWTGTDFADIFVMEQERRTTGRGRNRTEEISWSSPVQADGDEEVINTEDHESGMVMDSRGNLYYTTCPRVRRAHLGCAIWSSRKSGSNFQTPELVYAASDSSYSVGQPALNADGSILYFAGNIPGTKGNFDLWMTTFNRRERAWNEPTNLGSLVNTDGQELWPYVHDDGYMYFASDGLPGLGGLDIFRVKLGEDGMPEGEPENMKWPINSPGHDFGLIFEPGGEAANGYMSSSWEERDDHRGETDLYEVYLVPLRYTISGVLASTKDRSPVAQATVTLTGGDNPITVNTDADGYYEFNMDQLDEDMNYTISYSKQKFFANEANATTVGVPLSAFDKVEDDEGDYFIHNITLNVGMDPIEVPIVLPNVLFETGKWDLSDSSRAALDTVVNILERNPNITIELRSHTDYTDTDERNRILSQKRADTCVSYLISKGISADRLTPVGRGEDEPFVIPDGYDGLYSDQFTDGQELSEAWIKRQPAQVQRDANQLNRRTDMKVLRDDYVPAETETAESNDSGGGTNEGGGNTAQAGPPPGELYTIEGNTNYGRVARDVRVSPRVLQQLNGNLRGVRLVDGMVIKITPDGDYTEFDRTHYLVKTRGLEFDDIADELGMDEDVLEELNPDWEGELPMGLYIRIE